MSTRIIVLFNLKPGVTAADYEAWATSTDVPTVNNLKSVDTFSVWKSVGLLGSDETPPFAYVEILDVSDMEAFGGETSTETMQAVAGAFQEMATDLSFILTDKLG